MLRCVWVGLALCLVCQAETVKGDPGVERFWKRQIDADYRTLMSNPKKALKWTAPRLEISEAEALKGRGELESFAAENLPNAFRRYEKAKERATELQQVFCEDFPEPEKIDERHPERAGFERVLRRLCEARGNFFRRHDEFAHYYLLKKVGVVSAEDLAKIDAAPIAVKLERENPAKAFFELPSGEPLPAKYAEFIQKYMPMTRMVYPRLEEERGLAVRLLGEMKTAIREMDIAREEPCRAAVVEKVEKISAELEEIRKIYLDHRTGDLDVDALAALDRKKGTSIKALLESLPGFVASVLARPSAVTDICGFRMVKIPGKDYWMGETEVTRAEWMEVMGATNDVKIWKPDGPHEKIAADDIKVEDWMNFIRVLSMREDVVASGFQFRLPTREEWEYACRAGSTGHWGLRSNGVEGPLNVMGWYNGNRLDWGQGFGLGPCPVALKEPNAWGLFDMHGNVAEFVISEVGGDCDVYKMGGCSSDEMSKCRASSISMEGYAGLRLCASKVDWPPKKTSHKAGDARTVILPGGVPLELVYCPPGEFMMGSPETEVGREVGELQHLVRLTRGFWIGRYEVTQRQWQSLMGKNPSWFEDGERPVECVSYDDALNFLDKARYVKGLENCMLPTEAQWEWACRAGSTTALPSGMDLTIKGVNNAPELDSIAWYGGNSSVDFSLTNGVDSSSWRERQFGGDRAGTHRVGLKSANAWGIHDMIGNVWEWCRGSYVRTACGLPIYDPVWSGGGLRVRRGGCWRDYARVCRSAYRFANWSSDRSDIQGFRLCCSAGPRD